MNIYISASWKQRDRVRALAEQLRAHPRKHEVYDFTDGRCRATPELPPERFPEQFNPAQHTYGEYLFREEWRAAVDENRRATARADMIVLLLPCGIDATADWALGMGMGKRSIVVGAPPAGERSPVHLWADTWLPADEDVLPYLHGWQSTGSVQFQRLRG